MTDSESMEWSTKTFGNEDTLPRVPLPSLEESCERFLEWCAPLLSDEQLSKTKVAVDDMLRPDSTAHRLHAALVEYNDTPGVYSWLDTFWPSRYLGRRDRIALNANFFFLFKDADQTQVERAASLITGAVHYKQLLDQEELPPIIQRGQALSMEQNKFLFSETRIPGATQDSVRVPYSDTWSGPSQARHIAVFHKGHIFKLDVLSPGAQPYSLQDLKNGLDEIIMQTTERGAGIGSLTTKARAAWAVSRKGLLTENAEAFETVETALFCLCLDDISPQDAHEASDHLLHGDSGNRWFDKSVSLIVFANGQAGINVEHCGLDGTTILNFVDAILQSADEQPTVGKPSIEEIVFVLNDEQRADVNAAADAFAVYAAGTATQIVSLDNFGSNNVKHLGMSPDAFAQMAYQLAHQRTKGMIGATYESIATRQYQHGRTEAMRVVTPEVLEFVAAMEEPSASRETKQAAFRAAAEKHVTRAKQCQAGQAPEQHLWELQLIQKRGGAELGATEPMSFYDSPGWLVTRDDYLSTSSAPSVNVQYFGFGSTSLHCIGIGYVMLPERWNVYLSTPKQGAGDMQTFASNLRHAVVELQELLA